MIFFSSRYRLSGKNILNKDTFINTYSIYTSGKIICIWSGKNVFYHSVLRIFVTALYLLNSFELKKFICIFNFEFKYFLPKSTKLHLLQKKLVMRKNNYL